MLSLVSAFSLLVAAAGWFYMFYSQAAQRLSGVEDAQFNVQRMRLRRLGGAMMLLLAVAFFAGAITVDPGDSPWAFLTIWFIVVVLLGGIVVLALADLRLTMRLRRGRKERMP